MPKTKPTIPRDCSTLQRWLVQAPSERVKQLETAITKGSADDFKRHCEFYRIGLKWAWDEQPKVFFTLIAPWLKSTNGRLRRVAAGALPLSHEDFREKATKQLKKLITDKDKDVRRVAIDLLAENVNDNLELVKRWVRDSDPAVRTLVARHLQHLEPDKIRANLPLLEPLVIDEVPEVHWTAASTLLELYEREQRPVLEIMRPMANAETPDIRAAAAAAFFEHVFADHFDQILPTIRSWLRAGDANLRWTLVRSLRFIRVSARSMQLLRALYEDKDPEIRRKLVVILLELYDPIHDQHGPIMTLLRRARTDPSKRVREVVEEGLKRFEEAEKAKQEAEEEDAA